MLKKVSACGVRVATWGAESGGNHPMKHHLDQELFGGNTGHAAISLTIPVTPENEKMIKEYCSHPPIPVEKHLIKVPQSKRDENGNWVPDYDAPPAFQEEVFVVSFTWWPGTGGYVLGSSINKDGYDERVGVPREWNPKFREFIQPEQRIHGGKLARSKMTYGALNVEHLRNLEMTSDERKYLNLKAQIAMYENLIDSLKVAKDKIKSKRKEYNKFNLRQENFKNKDELIKNKRDDIVLLEKVKEALINEKRLKLSDAEKERLKELHPEFDPDQSKPKAKDQRQRVNQEFEPIINKIRVSIKRLNEDSPKKLLASEQKLLTPSETEIIQFDRFYPTWRQDFNYDKNKRITMDDYEKILDRLSEIKLEKEEEIKKAKEELKKMDYLTLPPELKAERYELKKLTDQLAELTKRQDELDKEFDKIFKLEDFNEISDFFNDTYLDDDSDDYLEADSSCVDIDKKIREMLDKFTATTEIDWKTIVDIDEDDPEPTISKEEINKLDDYLFDYIKKAEALALFNQYVDENNPKFIKDDDVIKIEGELGKILKSSKRYCGKSLSKLVSDKNQITGKELRELRDATIKYQLKIEKKSEKRNLQNIMDKNGEKINEIQLKRENNEASIDKLEKKIEALQNSEGLKKHKDYQDLVDKADDVSAAFRIMNEKINQKEKKKISDNIKIGDTLERWLDDAYEGNSEIKDWKKHFLGEPVPDPLRVSLETLKKIRDDLAMRSQELNKAKLKEMPTMDCFTAQDFESFLTMGLPPEAEYRLSLDTTTDPVNGIEWGMDAKSMLEKMHQIVSEGVPFDLNVNNCSVTVAKILEAGAKGEHLKSRFKDRVLGTIVTPQLIANNTEDYLRDYKSSPKDNFIKRIARWNPLEKALGKQIHSLLSKDTSKGEKRAAIAKTIGIGVVLAPVQLVKGLLSPTESLKKATNLIKFAQSKDHMGFKLGATALGGLGVAFFSAPALIETVIKAPFRLVKAIVESTRRKKIIKSNIHGDMTSEALEDRAKKERELKEKVGKEAQNVITIKATDPLVALDEARLARTEGKIPMFEVKTRMLIERHLENLKDPSLKEMMQQQYQDIIDSSVKKAMEVGQPEQKRKKALTVRFNVEGEPQDEKKPAMQKNDAEPHPHKSSRIKPKD